MAKRVTILLLAALTMTQWCAAATFRTQRLEQLARAIHLNLPEPLGTDQRIDSATTHLGKPVRVCTNRFGEVSHIGYCLFAPELAAHYQNEPLFQFVERYLLELDLRIDGKSPDLRMDVDRVVLTKGSISLLRTLTPQANFSFDLEEIRRRFFRLTWHLESGSEVSMVVPADCQLIIGATSPEMELMAERDILRSEPMDRDAIMKRWAEVKGYRGDKMLILDGGAYMSRYIRGDLYLSEQDGQLLFNPWQPSESVSNLMLTGLSQAADLPVALTMNRYGGKRDQLDITLRQYISYCLGEGCVLYFGVKQKTDTELTGALFAYNARFAYTHLLDVTFPLSLLNEGTGKIQCTSWVYIPLKLLDDHLFDKQFSRMPEKQ